MLKIKNWIVEEKKHIRFYHDWNDKEVRCTECMCVRECFCVSISVWCNIPKQNHWAALHISGMYSQFSALTRLFSYQEV